MEAIDKGGNFIGWLFVDGINLSLSLVEAGLAKVHFTAERSSHYKSLLAAEEKAKEQKLQVFPRSLFQITQNILYFRFLGRSD